MKLETRQAAVLRLIDKVANAYYLYYEKKLSPSKIAKALELDSETVLLYARKGKELLATKDLTILRDLYTRKSR